jgi:GNAT superfamily N-acetyltransferase
MLRIRPATTDEDLAEFARIVSTVTPDEPTSVEEIHWADAAYPGGRRFLAWVDDTAVGAAGVGRVYMYPPEFDGLWGNLSVLAEHRGRGVGSALLATICDVASEAGKSILIGRTAADRPAAIEFLEHRGFREYERMKVVRLELRGIDLPPVDPPDGVMLSSLAEHPELVPSIYEVAGEVLADIPGDAPQLPDTLEEFRKRDVERPTLPPDAFMLAIEAASGRVVGYANLQLVPGNAKVAWHGMTGVARAWRGRGLATALKRATIQWAIENGLEALETANDVVNEPMRAVNRRLGYMPLPDEIEVRGPLWPRRPAQRETLEPPPRYVTAMREALDG